MANIKDIIYDALTERGYEVDFQDGGLIITLDEYNTPMSVVVRIEEIEDGEK